MTTIVGLTADLGAEHVDLDELVAPLDNAGWRLPTPSPGWDVHDQIAHLAYFDRSAAIAIADPDEFVRLRSEAFERAAAGSTDSVLDDAAAMDGLELLEWWRTMRADLLSAAAGLAEDGRLEWYGPPMGAKSFLTARLMETWAHGQDVADAVGRSRAASERLRHIAELGVITRKWSYANRGRDAPLDPVEVRLMGPDGAHWQWGDPAAAQHISGSALDFCLVVTQRRSIDDTGLDVVGDDAAEWMTIAQAFAGPPTDGPGAARTS